MRYGRKLTGLLLLGMLFVFLVAAEDACGDDRVELDDPAPTPTATEELLPAPAPTEEAAPEAPAEDEELTALAAEIAYLDVSADLLGSSADILDRLGGWSAGVVRLYDQGVMFPPTDIADEALIEAKAITDQVRKLTVPPGYEESYAFWLAAQESLEEGIALGIAGVDEFEPDLINEGTAKLAEGTELLDLAMAAFPE